VQKRLKGLDDRLVPRGSSRFAAVMNLAIAVVGLALTVVAVGLVATGGWTVLRVLQAVAGTGMILFGGYIAARNL
jgi:hypothetical protein